MAVRVARRRRARPRPPPMAGASVQQTGRLMKSSPRRSNHPTCLRRRVWRRGGSSTPAFRLRGTPRGSGGRWPP
eukprot:13187572-Alexandrium_andersonii.AAC.1